MKRYHDTGHFGHIRAELGICRTNHQLSCYLENWPLLPNSLSLAFDQTCLKTGDLFLFSNILVLSFQGTEWPFWSDSKVGAHTLNVSALVCWNARCQFHACAQCSLHSSPGGPWGKAHHMHGQCRKRLWLTWRQKSKGWSCIMQWKSQLGLSCHAEKTYIKESAERLLGKSRYERGELLQQWKTQAEKCSNHYKQNTVQSTSITHERQLRDEEGRDRGGKVRTELAITLMRWFHWPSFHTHIFL